MQLKNFYLIAFVLLASSSTFCQPMTGTDLKTSYVIKLNLNSVLCIHQSNSSKSNLGALELQNLNEE